MSGTLIGAWLNDSNPQAVWWGKWRSPSGLGFTTRPLGLEAPQGVPLERWDTSGRIGVWVSVDPADAAALTLPPPQGELFTSPRPASGPAPAEDKPHPQAVGECSLGLSSRTARATSTRGLPEAAGSPTSLVAR